MLMLIFHIGDESYAIECQHIVEVIPLIAFSNIPHAPEFVLGSVNFYGVPVPVIDFCHLITGRPCEIWLHTRIMILSDPSSAQGSRLLGLMAEKVVEVMDIDTSVSDNEGYTVKKFSCIGKIVSQNGHSIQCVKVEELFLVMKSIL